MRDIGRRIKNIEKRLNLAGEHITFVIVWFGERLPPDRTEGNMTIRFVKYERGQDEQHTKASI